MSFPAQRQDPGRSCYDASMGADEGGLAFRLGQVRRELQGLLTRPAEASTANESR